MGILSNVCRAQTGVFNIQVLLKLILSNLSSLAQYIFVLQEGISSLTYKAISVPYYALLYCSAVTSNLYKTQV